jgi:hypothetical protein
MNRFLFVILFSACVASSQNSISIAIDTIITGKMSVRAILPNGDKIWYAADEGRYGFFNFSDNTTYEKRIIFDTIKPEFRSIAQTKDAVFILSIGTPALLYKIDKQTLKTKLVYRETHKNTFYDAMHFFDDNDGIAVGDPIDDKFSILMTHDGGNSWNKIDDAKFPQNIPGEAAFAASNSNIAILGNQIWIASGGKKSRMFYSDDRGRNWKVFNTPMIDGSAMTGTFTCDFYDRDNGIIAGGDYEKSTQNFGNKAITIDGGKTWKRVAENEGFGYASCIQFIPDNLEKRLMCVGATGIWYSPDFGSTWKKLSDDKSLYTIRIPHGDTAYAAGKDKIIRIRFKK